MNIHLSVGIGLGQCQVFLERFAWSIRKGFGGLNSSARMAPSAQVDLPIAGEFCGIEYGGR
jgi:hypothetical protein